MSANEHQVGGTHYKTSYEHWDLVLDVGMGYLEGQVTKYATRWRKKNGIEDLQKALHFLNKLQERWGRADVIANRVPYNEASVAVGTYAAANSLDGVETGIVLRLSTWSGNTDLVAVQELLFVLMDEARAGMPVPLTEENHHADRAGGPDGAAP